MVYLILIPLGQMIIQTLTLAGADAARVDGGREGMFTLYYWKRVLTSSISDVYKRQGEGRDLYESRPSPDT